MEKRQGMPYKEAQAESKAMIDEQGCAYAAYGFRQEAAQAVTV